MADRAIANGSPMRRMFRAGSVGSFRTASLLPPDSQRIVDESVNQVGVDRLVIVQDMIDEGLVYNLPNWMSVLEISHDRQNRAGHAQRTMVPKVRGERQVMDMDRVTIPVYITWDDFSFNAREIAMAERVGLPLDVSHAAGATRNVNEAIEDAAINGIGFNVRGNGAPGILNAPSANTQAYVDGEAWTASGHSGEDVLADVQNMIDLLQGDKYYGPYNLYIPTLYGSKLDQDYKSATSGTIRERLEKLIVGGRPLRIRVADQLPANRTVMMQMTSNVADVVVGQQPVHVSWEDNSGWEETHVVMACVIPRFKDDYDGNSGIVVGNLT